MAAADYDRDYRPYAAPAPAGEYDRPYRNEVVPYGDRRLDIVVKPPRSPPPPLPVSTRSGGGGVGSAWCFSDPEMKRRRRVASYKAYSVEGKVKASFRRGFRWIKAKCSELIHGWLGKIYECYSICFVSSSITDPRHGETVADLANCVTGLPCIYFDEERSIVSALNDRDIRT